MHNFWFAYIKTYRFFDLRIDFSMAIVGMDMSPKAVKDWIVSGLGRGSLLGSW
jgi:hypothetical protein